MKNQIETLKSEIVALTEQLNNKKQEKTLNDAAIEMKKEEMDNYEIDPDSLEESYKEALNESYEMPNGWDYSDVLERMDPIMYRCGLNDYVDSFDKEDQDDYKELMEQLEDLESVDNDLYNNMDDLMCQLEEKQEMLQVEIEYQENQK